MSIRQNLKEKIQDFRDKVAPRNLGYVDCRFAPEEEKKLGLPERVGFNCFIPYSLIKDSSLAAKIAGGERKILTTSDYGANIIKKINREQPEFNGIILEPAYGTLENINKAMQIYADKYDVPVIASFNGRYHQKQPQKNAALQNQSQHQK